jgi:hypothetical protein
MTGQVTGHQSPGETGGAEHHDIELTVPAHQFILGKPPSDRQGLPHDSRHARHRRNECVISPAFPKLR